ncbi:hypothetical protein YQE_06391, partial [Dendroctonus ponderosae]
MLLTSIGLFTEVTIKFLVSDHSYLPNDRHFAQIERRRRIKKCIVPEDIKQLIRETRSVQAYKVVKMEPRQFLNLQAADSLISAAKLAISTLSQIRVTKDNPGCEKQLVDVEQDVKIIQQELLEVQKEREHLEHHRKMLALSPPCHPSPCPSPYPSCKPYPPCGHPPCPTLPCCPSEASGEDQPFKEMKEKYARLQEDFKAKLTEVAGLRADNEKLKELADKAEENRAKLDMKGIGSREQLIDLQQQLKVHKELYRQAQDELEELRALVEDIQGQLNDYQAIQTIEEQRRQIEIMRMENNRISEQVNLEIVRVKNQFQEKLQELAPLPDILKATQVKAELYAILEISIDGEVTEGLEAVIQIYSNSQAALNAVLSVKMDSRLIRDSWEG